MSTKSTKKTTKVAAVAEPAPVVEVTVEAPTVVLEKAKSSKSTKTKSATKLTKPAKPVVEAEVEVEAEEASVVESTLVAPKKKLTVAKGEITVVSKKTKKAAKSPRSAAKSPRTSRSPAKTPRSPAKTPRSTKSSPAKSPSKSKTSKVVAKTSTKTKKVSKSPTKTTKKGGVLKKATKKGGKKTKVVKPRRPHNLKPAPLDYAGVGIGPARVKKVLTCTALNPREALVRRALLKAENRPVRPKPTEKNPNPEMPAQGPQTPIDKLAPEILAVVREAEKSHQDSLTEDYEKSIVATYSQEKKDAYQELRKAAASKDGFNLHAFNVSYDKKFYDGFAAYCVENDSYMLGRKFIDNKTKESYEKYNQWTRATALVNKLCTRLSSETRNILAAYLDNLVIQYASNGIYNCIQEGRSIVQLRHALTPNEGFDERVPLDAFARTLSNYQLALNWLDNCREIREDARRMKEKGDEVQVDMPEYPNPDYDEDFDGYAVDICRSVRISMAESQTVAAVKKQYLDASISSDFKRFCSFLIYEAILRVGAVLKSEVALGNVKTVSEKLMYHALRQIHNSCGIDFESVQKDLEERLKKFDKWREERREARKNRKNKAAEDADADEDAEDAEESEEESEDVEPADTEVAEEEEEEEDAEEEDEEVEVEDDEEVEVTYDKE
jgi:hypothetical protein